MRNKRFTFLCTVNEREALIQLAKFHHRSQGDVVRLLIFQAWVSVSSKTIGEATSVSPEDLKGKPILKKENENESKIVEM